MDCCFVEDVLMSYLGLLPNIMDYGFVKDVPGSYLGQLPKKNGLWLCKGCYRELSGAVAKEEWIVAL